MLKTFFVFILQAMSFLSLFISVAILHQEVGTLTSLSHNESTFHVHSVALFLFAVLTSLSYRDHSLNNISRITVAQAV